MGHPVIGHLVAHRGGHGLHTAFAEKILAESDAWRIVESPGSERTPAAAVAAEAPDFVTR